MHYVSFDIAAGYRTILLDLNNAAVPDALWGKFDLVLNFGTTEHILNQLNCFKVVHDATKVGGHIFHSLPAVGYVDHGYITYTGRCFFDVAGFNGYDLVACWFDGYDSSGGVLDSLKSYSVHFPALKTAINRIADTEKGRILRDLRIPDINIYVICRKLKDGPFRGALDFSTSIGAIPLGSAAVYGRESSESLRSARLEKSLRRRAAVALQQCPPLYGVARRAFRKVTGNLGLGQRTAVSPLTTERQPTLEELGLARSSGGRHCDARRGPAVCIH